MPRSGTGGAGVRSRPAIPMDVWRSGPADPPAVRAAAYPGIFPLFLMSRKGTCSASATGAPRMNPRASKPATDVGLFDAYRATMRSTVAWKVAGSSVCGARARRLVSAGRVAGAPRRLPAARGARPAAHAPRP